jgi:acetyl-CoA carboxylase carboxyltransferase component
LSFALPTTRVAVMGPAGKEFVYKQEMRDIRGQVKGRVADRAHKLVEAGASEEAARREAEAEVQAWFKEHELELSQRYERELMNPREALSLGSVSQLVMPTDLRRVLGEHLEFCLRHYEPAPMAGVQREFH